MEEKSAPVGGWVTSATRGIRFGPDRRAVARELEDHLEDKAQELIRLYQLPPEEARAQAEGQMGDAEEIGRALARLHRPWLGFLWTASKWGVRILVLLCMGMNFFIGINYRGHPIWSGSGQGYPPVLAVQPAQVDLGGYTFRILGATYYDYPEESDYQDELQVVVQVSSPRFWERLDQRVMEQGLISVTREGAPGEQGGGERTEFQVTGHSRGLFDRTFTVKSSADWQHRDWVTLEFSFELGSIQHSAQTTREERDW